MSCEVRPKWMNSFHCIESLFEVVFHSLDVVVGDFFDVLDFDSVFGSHIQVEAAEPGKEFFPALAGTLPEAFQLGQGNPAQCDVVLYFHPHPVADESEFTEIILQGCCLRSIAAVYRRHGHKGIQICHNTQRYPFGREYATLNEEQESDSVEQESLEPETSAAAGPEHGFRGIIARHGEDLVV